MKMELEIISDIYNANEKLIKKDMIYKKVFDLDQVEIEQFVSSRGMVVKKYCTLTSNNKYYKVNNSYDYIKSLVTPLEVKGFAGKSRKR